MKAIIIDNKPYCPKCKVGLGNQTGHYDLVENEDGERYYQFERYCDKCLGKFRFESDIRLGYDTVHYSLKKVKTIKDSSNIKTEEE